MMKLIEERDRKLAERGIFTVEQEIAGQIIFTMTYMVD